MSNRKRFHTVPSQLSRSLSKAIKIITNWLSRHLLNLGRFQGDRKATAGFVLPTAAMMMLVVTLIATAMVLRSFDRSKNAHNYRVNQATLNAAAPALDRAKAKIEQLFSSPTATSGNTPKDEDLLRVIEVAPERYTFGDETPLKVVFDVNGDGQIGQANPAPPRPDLEYKETITTAWKFPVDTDNNGKFDTYTLYGIYFRSPSRVFSGANAGEFERPRFPLDARTPPMDEGNRGGRCTSAVATSANLVGDSGWYQVGDRLKKSIFVFAANIPITEIPPDIQSNGTLNAQYETFSGTGGFSALEYQQDRSRIPLNNNAVVYRDDLEVLPGGGLNLNGRVVANSNLLVGRTADPVRFYLVSSPNSCYYKEEISKILVGGNLAAGPLDSATDTSPGGIDLFGRTGPKTPLNRDFGRPNKSVTGTTGDGGSRVSYNTNAFNRRIDYMVNAAMWRGNGGVPAGTVVNAEGYPDPEYRGSTALDPEEVQRKVAARLSENNTLVAHEVRQEELEVYFQKRTRQVPYAEVPAGGNPLLIAGGAVPLPMNSEGQANGFFGNGGNSPLTGANPRAGTNELRPPDRWMYPVNPTNSADPYTNLVLNNITANVLQPEATDPDQRNGEEIRIGDRVLVGNNLPALVYDINAGEFVPKGQQVVTNGATPILWRRNPGTGESQDPTPNRYRESQVQDLPSLGVTERDNFWEESAAIAPTNPADNSGGLRVITGTGIYVPGDNSVALTPVSRPIWPDYMPMPDNTPQAAATARPVFDANGKAVSDNTNNRPFLRMRATAVYHYKHSPFVPGTTPPTYQTPLACVSSYYDPTDSTTAQNTPGLPVNPDVPASTTGKSNNGVVYPWSGSNLGTGVGGIGSYDQILRYQAALRYPNGRLVNPLLKSAFGKIDANTRLSIAEQSALDSGMCALDIMRGVGVSGGPPFPHMTFRETAFLDAREIKAIDVHSLRVSTGAASGTTRTYTLPDGVPTPALQPRNTPADYPGDLVTIDGFAAPNEALNVKRGRITNVSGNTITVETTTSASIGTVTLGPNDPQAWITETLSGKYNLGIEQRQPLEIRATVMDIENMRVTTVGPGPAEIQEYLLPNSGIVYASREDGMPDETGSTSGQSSTDFLLDPDRRPNALLLVNGQQLNRGPANTNTFRNVEKGLILASNVPAYIRGNFNLHTGNGGEEFEPAQALNTNPGNLWNNFYTRTALNQQFACRVGQFPECTTGDTWRSATILSDALTMLSDRFQFGFRNEGDYDLRDNLLDARSIQKRRENGFFANNFVTSRPFEDVDYAAAATGALPLPRPANVTPATLATELVSSSYFNNFVTPVQRRVTHQEYLMEVCPKLPVSECGPMDWWVKPPSTPGATDGYKVTNSTAVPAGGTVTDSVVGLPYSATAIPSGTTAKPATATIPNWQNYPRRVAFLRDYRDCSLITVGTPPETCGGDLILDNVKNEPIPIGIDGTGNIKPFPYSASALDLNRDGTDDGGSYPAFSSANRPRLEANTLWFRTTRRTDPTGLSLSNPDNRDYGTNFPLDYRTLDGQPVNTTANTPGRKWQPLLAPVPQLLVTNGNAPANQEFLSSLMRPSAQANTTHWMQHAPENGNTFNIVIAAGDSPARPFESNGGVANFPRFLESWNPSNSGANAKPARINGGFLQLRRSSYATAPFRTLLPNTTAAVPGATFPANGIYLASTGSNDPGGTDGGVFSNRQIYRTLDNANGTLPYYFPPARIWGFDVGLLTQSPDLFAQRFTVPPSGAPNEFFREVSRDDQWIQTLLCAAQPVTERNGSTPIPGGYPINDGTQQGFFNEPAAPPLRPAAISYKFAVPENLRPNCSAAQGSALRP